MSLFKFNRQSKNVASGFKKVEYDKNVAGILTFLAIFPAAFIGACFQSFKIGFIVWCVLGVWIQVHYFNS